MTEPKPSTLTLSDLDFEEAELLEDTLDMSIDEIGARLQGNKPKVKIIRAIKWLEMRRSDPSATFDDAKHISIMAAFAGDDDDAAEGKGDAKPTPKRSGRRAASSTALSLPPSGDG